MVYALRLTPASADFNVVREAVLPMLEGGPEDAASKCVRDFLPS